MATQAGLAEPRVGLPKSREAEQRRASGRGSLGASSRLLEARRAGRCRSLALRGARRWEEKLSAFPRSPTHLNELSGGTPPRRLPRIRPPGSPAPFEEASGGGWTLAALSARPEGRALPAWLCALLGLFFPGGLQRAQPDVPGTREAPSPCSHASGSQSFSAPQSREKFGRQVS